MTSSSPSATATAVAVAPSASSEPSAPKSVGASRDGETVRAADQLVVPPPTPPSPPPPTARDRASKRLCRSPA